MFGNQITFTENNKQKATVLGPVTCAWGRKFSRNQQCPADVAEACQGAIITEPCRVTGKEMEFQLPQELMYGGQGKHRLADNHSTFQNHCHDAGNAPNECAISGPKCPLDPPSCAGLQQPCLSSNAVVLGHNKTTLRKENKQQGQALRAGQSNISPCTKHQGLTHPAPPTDHKARPDHRNSMFPAGRASTHPAAHVLKEWATHGCPTRTGKPWSK